MELLCMLMIVYRFTFAIAYGALNVKIKVQTNGDIEVLFIFII